MACIPKSARTRGIRDRRIAIGLRAHDRGFEVQVPGFRYYSPGLGRWVNRDPIGERGGVNCFAFALNDAVDLIELIGLAPTRCWGVGVRSFAIGVSIRVPLPTLPSANLRLLLEGRGAIKGKRCTKCCDDGRTVTDDTISVAGSGMAKLLGTTASGQVSFGQGLSGSYWLGIYAAVSAGGSVSGQISSDRCNNRELVGSVCLTIAGSGEIGVGGSVTLQLGLARFKMGLLGRGIGTISTTRCYRCNGVSCAWDPRWRVCMAGSLDVQFRAFFYDVTWSIISGSTCFDWYGLP